MASVFQKCVCTGLLVLICLSFSFAHRVVLDHSGDDYRKLKATVMSGQDGAGPDGGDGRGRMRGSRVGPGSMAAENRHPPGSGMTGGSRTGTKRFPETTVHLTIPLHPVIPQYILKPKSSNEEKKRSKTTQSDGGQFEPAAKARTKTTHGDGGEIELTPRAMTKKEMKIMANGAMKPMPEDDMELTTQANVAMDPMPRDDMELTKQANVAMETMPMDDMEMTKKAHNKAGVDGSHV